VGGGFGIGGFIVLLILVNVIRIGMRSARRRGGSGSLLEPPMAPMPSGPAAYPFPTPSQAQGPAGGLAAIKAHDPGFDEARFVADAEKAFFTVQEAWTDCKPEMSRRVMADDIWQQHKVQIEQYVELGKRNVLENLAVANASIVGASSDAAFDTITLRLRAGCADYDVDVKNNKVLRGNRRFGEWTEDWLFQRSSDATTKVGGGTMASRCPNCGAPLDIDLQGTCKYCHVMVMSGKYDWVLTRIEQVLNGSDGGGYRF